MPRNIKNILQKKIETILLESKIENKKFCRLFNFMNSIFLKWPILVGYDDKAKAYILMDLKGQNESIYIGRKRRIGIYKKGVAERLNFVAEQYFCDSLEFDRNDLIIDVGANVGELSLFLAKHRNIVPICFEPEALEFQCLSLNLANYNDKGIFVNAPLWSEEREIVLYHKNETGDSSLIEPDNFSGQKVIKSLTLASFIHSELPNEKRVRLLKLEAEGAEPEILKGGLSVLDRIDYVAADVGPERGVRKERTLVAVNETLASYGFTLIAAHNIRDTVLYKNVKHFYQ